MRKDVNIDEKIENVKEDGELFLFDLNLTTNDLIKLIPKLSKIENLFNLYLNFNYIESLPTELFKLTNISYLSISNNPISYLPDEIEHLINLYGLGLSDTYIKFLPESIINLKNLNHITISFNSNIFIPSKIFDNDNIQLLTFINGDEMDYREFLEDMKDFTPNTTKEIIKIKKEFSVAFKQYLAYFNEYVKVTKGKNIEFEVHSVDDGLELNIKNSQDTEVEEIKEYLGEYVGFIKGNIDDLTIDTTQNPNSIEMQMMQIDLRAEIRQLQMKLESKVDLIETLKNDKINLNSIITSIVDSIKNLQPNIHNNLTQIQSQNQTVDIKIENHFNELRRDFVDFVDSIEDKELKEKAKKIEDELYEVDKPKKSLLNRVNDFIEKVKKTNSIVGKGINLYSKIVENIDKIMDLI